MRTSGVRDHSAIVACESSATIAEPCYVKTLLRNSMTADGPRDPGRDLGRVVVLAALGLIVAASITVITLYIAKHGPDRLFAQSIRFALTLGIAYLVYRGWRWARWLAVILFGGTGLFTLTLSSIALSPLGLVYLLSAVLLLLPAASRFLHGQEALRLASRDRSSTT